MDIQWSKIVVIRKKKTLLFALLALFLIPLPSMAHTAHDSIHTTDADQVVIQDVQLAGMEPGAADVLPAPEKCCFTCISVAGKSFAARKDFLAENLQIDSSNLLAVGHCLPVSPQRLTQLHHKLPDRLSESYPTSYPPIFLITQRFRD